MSLLGSDAEYPLAASMGMDEKEAGKKIPALLRKHGWIHLSDNRWMRPAGAPKNLPERVTNTGKPVR